MAENSINQIPGNSGQARGADSDPNGRTLATLLKTARETAQLDASQAARQSHVPGHYLQMLESGDYGRISDQLYLVPFLRRYAEFLKLDADDLAIRFVREIQGAENAAAKPAEATVKAPARNYGWITTVAVLAFVGGAVYVLASGRHKVTAAPAPHSVSATQAPANQPAQNSQPKTP